MKDTETTTTGLFKLIEKPVDLAIVDYGMGNRRSVEKAFEHIGANVLITADHERLRAAAGLVLPGVGAFPRGMANLRELGLDALLRERLAAGTPVLGICLGMQLAFERTTELGGAEGLGAIPGEVRELEHGTLKLPHIGWNEVTLHGSSPLTEGLPERCAFYHVHSFAPTPANGEDTIGTSVYGAPFASVVARDGFYGVQFHPEKSSAAGLRLLANFARICSSAAVPPRRLLVKLYPAIDMLGGHAVRLTKGDFDAKKVYDEDPLSAAKGWVEAGARYLHVVDLDGAKQGTPANLHHLRLIAGELDVPVQFGGGLRTEQAVSDALEAGAERVILGTAAFTNPQFLERCLELYPGKVLVSVDIRGGKVATAGWTETINLTATAVVERLWEQNASELVYTNVDRDGMLGGPDLQEVGDIARVVKGSLIYSGGIGALADLEGLVALKAPQLGGVIVGKALYERRFTVAEALTVLDG